LPEKNIAIRVDEELFKKVKVRLAEQGLTMKDYIINLIKKDLDCISEIDWQALSVNDGISTETVAEAQKVLDFVNDVISGKYSIKK